MIQKCVDLSEPFGRIVVVGVCMVEDTMTPISAIFKEINIQYVLGYGRPDWRLVLDLLDCGRVDPRPMITDIITSISSRRRSRRCASRRRRSR